MYKKILVPVDGSRASQRGLDEAIRLAAHHKAKLRLVHVVDAFVVTPTLEAGRYVDDIQKSFRASGTRLLHKAAALARRRRLQVDTVMFETVGGRAADGAGEEMARGHYCDWHAWAPRPRAPRHGQ